MELWCIMYHLGPVLCYPYICLTKLRWVQHRNYPFLCCARNFLQAGKLKNFGTHPNWAVSYIAYTKFHLPRGWGYWANFLRSVIFPFFPNDQNSGYLYIKFVFGRCHRSWAAETPGKYEHDWNYLTYTFAKSKLPVTEKLANEALVTPIPGLFYTRPAIFSLALASRRALVSQPVLETNLAITFRPWPAHALILTVLVHVPIQNLQISLLSFTL